jgi:hypothetical protein
VAAVERLSRRAFDLAQEQDDAAEVSGIYEGPAVIDSPSPIETRLAVIEAKIATKDDLINLGRWLTTLILPIYGVLIIVLIFLYQSKP